VVVEKSVVFEKSVLQHHLFKTKPSPSYYSFYSKSESSIKRKTERNMSKKPSNEARAGGLPAQVVPEPTAPPAIAQPSPASESMYPALPSLSEESSSGPSTQDVNNKDADGDTDMGYKDFSHEDRVKLVQAILSAQKDPSEIRRAWENAMPQNTSVKYKELKFILHPDRYPDPEMKKKADAAFGCK
jgi:hypothetical protein